MESPGAVVQVGCGAGVTGAQFACELGEMVRVGMLAPWGATVRGNRALLWLLGTKREPAFPPCRTPVVLVHGYGGHRSHWLSLELELRRAGFVNVRTVTYNPVTKSLGAIARALTTTCHEALQAAGSDHLHLVGHSLGGVVVRYAVQRLALAPAVRTAVTVAAPHRGAPSRRGHQRPDRLRAPETGDECLHARGGLDPHLLEEDGTEGLVGPERLGEVALCEVEAHEYPVGRLPQRIGLDSRVRRLD